MCCRQIRLSGYQISCKTMQDHSPSLSHLNLLVLSFHCIYENVIVWPRHSNIQGTLHLFDIISPLYLTRHPHRPLPASDRGLKDSKTTISTMGCASSCFRHDQRSECEDHEDVRPQRERQRRETPRRDRWRLEGPHKKRRNLEQPQGERKGRDGRHMKRKEREERNLARCGSRDLHREQRARPEPSMEQSGRQRLLKERRVIREPHRERRRQKDPSEQRRRKDVFRIGWAHPYVRKGFRSRHHKARGMRDETQRERYEPVRQAKENFRRQYDKYKSGNGVIPAPQSTPQRYFTNMVAPSTLNLSGMTLVNYHGIEVSIV